MASNIPLTIETCTLCIRIPVIAGMHVNGITSSVGCIWCSRFDNIYQKHKICALM